MYEIVTYSPDTDLVIKNLNEEEFKLFANKNFDFSFNELEWELKFKKEGKTYIYQGDIPNFGKKAIKSLELMLLNLGRGYLYPKDFEFLGHDDEMSGGSTVCAMIRRLRILLHEDGSAYQTDNFIQSVKRPYLIRFNPAYSYCWISRVPGKNHPEDKKGNHNHGI
ncbi:MAG: hypothetical protein JEZ07_15035 [Phycisphaerae bacterium]|nr:hypothetical protein [Phycisphaerae bacterium]